VRDLIFSQSDDASIVRALVGNVPDLSTGTVETVSTDISTRLSDLSHAEAIDEVSNIGGGFPRFNPDKTVDYVKRRGRDRPNTVLKPDLQNISFSKPEKAGRRKITHLRMIGDGIKADIVANDFTSSDRERWAINREHTDVSDVQTLRLSRR
jgi:hypothetical protein